MTRDALVRTYRATSLFVLLWSSGAIFARLGLDQASTFAFLTLRFALAFVFLAILALTRRPRPWPKPGSQTRVAWTGVLLISTYSTCYLLALDHGVTPGVLATILGAQPLLTLVLTERRFSVARAAGLCLSLFGLTIVVHDGLAGGQSTPLGIAFALGALAGATIGAILQKTIAQPPLAVLPLQYAISLAICLLLLPWQPLRIEPTPSFVLSLLWLALVISVAAQLLLYRLIRAGNLVNLTSLFYLVPIVTTAMDCALLGTPLLPMTLAGMAAILAGLAVVFRSRTRSSAA